jgi:hypothetical protein
MWFVIVLIALAIAFIVWFVRTPLFRAHLRGHAKDPGWDTSMRDRNPGNPSGHAGP